MIAPADISTGKAEFQLTDADFQLIRETVYEYCGIALTEQKRDLVLARLARQLRASRFRTVTEYVQNALADRNAAAFTELIDALSTNLTSFFREAQHFDYVENTFIPELIKRRNSRRLLAWSAACSSGEEPYTLGMSIMQSLAKSQNVALPTYQSIDPPAGWDVRILATDISTRVLTEAMAGRYAEERVQSIPPDFRSRYFAADDWSNLGRRRRQADAVEPGPVYQASSLLRRTIRFRHLNLISAWPFRGPFDLIFCRNVMIYFDTETQQRLINRFWDVLEPQGVLFTGHSESLSGVQHRFRQILPTIYVKA